MRVLVCRFKVANSEGKVEFKRGKEELGDLQECYRQGRCLMAVPSAYPTDNISQSDGSYGNSGSFIIQLVEMVFLYSCTSGPTRVCQDGYYSPRFC